MIHIPCLWGYKQERKGFVSFLVLALSEVEGGEKRRKKSKLKYTKILI